MPFNIENIKNSCVVANQTNWQGLSKIKQLIPFTQTKTVCFKI